MVMHEFTLGTCLWCGLVDCVCWVVWFIYSDLSKTAFIDRKLLVKSNHFFLILMLDLGSTIESALSNNLYYWRMRTTLKINLSCHDCIWRSYCIVYSPFRLFTFLFIHFFVYSLFCRFSLKIKIQSTLIIKHYYSLFSMLIIPCFICSQAMAEDENIKLLSFTGSTKVGHQVSMKVHERFGELKATHKADFRRNKTFELFKFFFKDSVNF